MIALGDGGSGGWNRVRSVIMARVRHSYGNLISLRYYTPDTSIEVTPGRPLVPSGTESRPPKFDCAPFLSGLNVHVHTRGVSAATYEFFGYDSLKTTMQVVLEEDLQQTMTLNFNLLR